MSNALDWTGARGAKWLKHVAGMEAMLAPVDEPLIRALNLRLPCRIADVGCGGGGTTLELARRAPAGSIVHGYDVSAAMIDFARGLERSDRCVVAFEAADMQSTAAPQERYDRLISRFGTMFYSDPNAAFANLYRWLVPGARFAFSVWGPQTENAWEASVRAVVAEFVDLPASGVDEPGPYRYAGAGTLLAHLERAGFDGLEVHDWRGKLAIGGGLGSHDAADFALAAYSSFAELLARAGTNVRDDAHRLLAARLSPFEEGGTVRMDARVHIVTGGRKIENSVER